MAHSKPIRDQCNYIKGTETLAGTLVKEAVRAMTSPRPHRALYASKNLECALKVLSTMWQKLIEMVNVFFGCSTENRQTTRDSSGSCRNGLVQMEASYILKAEPGNLTD